jgi:hypothetical protein
MADLWADQQDYSTGVAISAAKLIIFVNMPLTLMRVREYWLTQAANVLILNIANEDSLILRKCDLYKP